MRGWLWLPVAAAALVILIVIGAQVGERPAPGVGASATPTSAASPSAGASGSSAGASAGEIAVPLPLADLAWVSADADAIAFVRKSTPGTLEILDVATLRPRAVYAAPAGRTLGLAADAIEGGLVVFTEVEVTDAKSIPQRVVRRVMALAWRGDGKPGVLDEIPGIIPPDSETDDHAPGPRTNGSDVAWRHSVETGAAWSDEVRVRRSGATSTLPAGPWTFALDALGRVALSRSPIVFATQPVDAELSLWSGGAPRSVAKSTEPHLVARLTREVAVWTRLPRSRTFPNTDDVVDLATGSVRTLTADGCDARGATVRDAVFGCGRTLRLYALSDGAQRSLDLRPLTAGAHAILGQRADGQAILIPVSEPAASAPAPETPSAACSRNTTAAGTVTACPGQGPVGTAVTVSGTCRITGRATLYWVFENPDGVGGTEGWDATAAMGSVPVGADGTFRFTDVIPGTLQPIQQQGGGKTTPGGYEFITQPPACSVPFTVTAP